jgi:hypothetical protein
MRSQGGSMRNLDSPFAVDEIASGCSNSRPLFSARRYEEGLSFHTYKGNLFMSRKLAMFAALL